MSVESATWASQLSVETPRATDQRQEGAEQLRLLKTVYQNEFGTDNKQWVYVSQAPTRQSLTSFSVSSNETATYSVGRRVKIEGRATGTVYGYVTSATYSSSTNVNLRFDSGTLANESLSVFVSFLTDTGLPVGKIVTSDGTTGGSGTGGSGNQYILMTVHGVTYKVLYDGVNLGDSGVGLVDVSGYIPTVTRVSQTGGAYLENHTLFSYNFNYATGGLRVTADGVLETYEEVYYSQGWASDNNEWAVNRSTGVGSGFDVKLTRTTGTDPTGSAIGTWTQISSTQEWNWSTYSPGVVAFAGVLQIRPTGGSTSTASSNINITVQAEVIGGG